MNFVINKSQSLGVLPGTKNELVKQIEKMSRNWSVPLQVCKAP